MTVRVRPVTTYTSTIPIFPIRQTELTFIREVLPAMFYHSLVAELAPLGCGAPMRSEGLCGT